MTEGRPCRRRGSARERRTVGAIAQRPWKQITYRYPPLELMSRDQVEQLHVTALGILEEVGMKVLAPEARTAFASAGFDVDPDSEVVTFDRAGIEEWVAKAPSAFELHARNPSRNLMVGGNKAIYASVGGPAYCMDLDGGRRAGTYEEMCNFLRLVQSLNIVHQEGGGGFEPLDLPAETRHLDIFYAEITLMDKNWHPWGMGTAQAMDAINMASIMLEKTPEALVETPVFTCVINTNSPLQLDIPMAQGLMTMARFGQAVIVTPFTLAGAMSPVTLAGALAQQHAEAMAGIALTQIVCPGVPVMYGGFTSNVDMKTGAPAFGTPEYAQAAQASGQLARRLGIPFRSSNVNSANTNDAQAAYESMMSLWGAMTGQAHLINHAAGWLGGGLVASFEKLIIDAEMLQMMAAYMEPFAVDEASLALEVVREVGPAGHFFGTDHTMARYETAFNAPLVSNWDNYETWAERGQPTAETRANEIWKQLLRDYQQPPIDAGVDEALKDYVARAKREGRKVQG
jgi:trimethylamine--corrinoid protein Co-methyltransferase